MEASKNKAQHAAAEASPWIETLGRWGYGAKGVIYGLIGFLAFLAASGDGGKTTDQKGVINTIAAQPLGTPLLIVLGIGLFGYCIYRLAMAAFDPEGKGALKRVGYAVSGIAYGGFGFLAMQAALGDRAKDDSKQKAAEVLGIPGGEWLLVAFGLIIGAVGIVQLVNGFTGKYMSVLNEGAMSSEERKTALWSGRIGLISRGIVFLIMSWFLIRGGMDSDPNKAGGQDQALNAIANLPYGAILLGMMGIGLVLFGLYMFVEARYRKFTPVDRPQGREASAH